MVPSLHLRVYQEARMVRPADFPAKRQVTFSRELQRECAMMTENGPGTTTLSVEVIIFCSLWYFILLSLFLNSPPRFFFFGSSINKCQITVSETKRLGLGGNLAVELYIPIQEIEGDL